MIETLVIPLLRELREHRLAVDAVVAVAAGDDLDSAIERLRRVAESIPADEFPRRSKQHSIAVRAKEVAEIVVGDLTRVRETI